MQIQLEAIMITTGIDRLIQKGPGSAKRRIGLVTNPSGITSKGLPSWKALMDSGFCIGAFFGPEHGFRGDAQDAVHIEDGEFMGIPSYSLYGSRLAPEEHMLEALDVIIYDIQDVGCRYYTYLYTLANVAKVCEKTGMPLLVLDRPDPIGGVEVEGGPIADSAKSFVGGYRLCNRYGMTVGEFARYLKGEFFPGLELEVEELTGWSRASYFDALSLPWVTPSPNIPTLTTALVYPGTCFFEGTNVSEGRGTTRPFESIGAPWIDSEKLREALAAQSLPGVTFAGAVFTPTSSKFKAESCGGVSMSVLDRAAFRPLKTGVAILKTIHDLYPDRFEWKRNWEHDGFYFVDRLAGGSTLRTLIDSGTSLDSIMMGLSAGQDDFIKKRADYLIYR